MMAFLCINYFLSEKKSFQYGFSLSNISFSSFITSEKKNIAFSAERVELSRPNHGVSRVYHQFRKELYITNTECCISSIPQGIVYHQADRIYTLKRDDIPSFRRMIYSPKGADDIPSLSAWIKKTTRLDLSFFWRRRRDLDSRAGKPDLHP